MISRFPIDIRSFLSLLILLSLMMVLGSVTNARADSVLTTLSVGTSPTAIAADAATNKVYVANQGSADVTVIEGNVVVTPLATGLQPRAIALNALTNRIYVVNSQGDPLCVDAVCPGTVTVINGADNSVVTTVTVGLTPNAIAVNSDTDTIYVTNSQGDPLDAACTDDTDATVCSGTVSVIDGSTDTVTATVTVGTNPWAIALNPLSDMIYVANLGSDNVTVIDGFDNSVFDTVAVGTAPFAIAVNSDTAMIYVANGDAATVTAIDGLDDSTATISVGTIPTAIAINSITNQIYVANQDSSDVTVINGADNSTTALAAGAIPFAVAVNQATNKIYVANLGSDNLTIIDANAANALSTLADALALGPIALAVNEVTGTIYVANSGSGNVSVIDGSVASQFITFGAAPLIPLAGTGTVTATASSGLPVTFSSLTAGVCTVDANTGLVTALAFDTCTIAADQAGDADFNPAPQATLSFTVGLTPQTITFGAAPAMTLGGPTGTVSATASSGLAVTFTSTTTSVCTVAGSTVTALSAGTCTIAGNQAGNGTFFPAPEVTQSFAIDRATLASLTISSGTLTPTFATGTLSYTVSVGNAVTSVTLTPTATDGSATITVNASPVASGVASGAIALAVGANPILVVVTGQDGVTAQTYTVTVTRAPSGNADLSNLVLSSGTLAPAFASGTLSYTASVINAVSSITVTPTVADATATVTVNGTPVASGSPSGAIALAVGSNPITIAVTAQNSTIQTYTVTVTRPASANANLSSLVLSSGTLAPAFASGTLSYTASVINAVSSITVTPTLADATATVTVNGTPVASGSPSGAIALAVGSTPITIAVTAQNGTLQTYTVTVTRPASANANLSNLVVSSGTLTPAFASGTLSYTDTVANAVTSITVTPTVADNTATVTVNGTPVASGNPSGAIALPVGSTPITIAVTAQNGTLQTYTVTVTRQTSANANLSSLVVSSGTLAPAFDSATLTYTDAVPNAVTSITVTPTLADATATVTVSGIPVASGNASGAIALAEGNNPISVVVTAQNGTTVQTYIVNVTRGVTAQMLIDDYYQGILGRAGDAGGIAFWDAEALRLAGLGADPAEVYIAMAVAFYGSAEFAARGLDDGAFVDSLYITFLNRAADPDGRAFWIGQIAAGLSREMVMYAFLFSPEFSNFMAQNVGAAPSRAEVYAVLDFYRGAFGRLPDSDGLKFWVNRFRAAQCSGDPAAAVLDEVHAIASGFFESGEYWTPPKSNGSHINNFYNAFMRRGADVGGYQFWVNQLAAGADFNTVRTIGFIDSAEFALRVQQIVAAGCTGQMP